MWARHLRRRHSRQTARRAAGSMVLAIRDRAVRLVRIAARVTVINIHGRCGVTGLPSPCMFGATGVTRISPPAAAGRLTHRLGTPRSASSTSSTAGFRASGSSTVSPPFVHPPAVLAQSRPPASRANARSLMPHTGIVTRWRGAPASASVARAWHARLRQRGVRQDLAVAAGARVLSARPTVEVAAQQPVEVESSATVRGSLDAAGHGRGGPPALNVDALTNHVIQQLDRRFIAYRERMGRA